MKQDKNSFILGLSIGIAVVSLVGFIIMAMAYVEKGDNDLADSDTKKNVAANKANPSPTPTPTTPPAPAPTVKADLSVKDGEYIRGNKNAAVTIIEFSDYQCPYCTRFHDTMKQVMAAYPNDVRWVYRHFPLDSIHPYARQAAESAECAGDQGKFWEYSDELFANQSSFSSTYFGTLANELRLNTTQFEKCIDDGKFKQKVTDDFNEGRSNGVTGTPGSFINGELIKGALPFASIEATIKSQL